MEEGAIGNRLRQIECPAAIGVEMDASGEQAAGLIVAHGELSMERMAMAGDGHVLIAVETNTHR